MYQSIFRNPVFRGLTLVVCVSVFIFNFETLRAEEPAELANLIVSAGLVPISIRDVASSVTVISREEIDRRQAKTLAELLRDVPGFVVSQSGGAGALTQVRVRGSEANQLLVLMDGIRANDPASGDEFQFQYALTANIERIEIIRGPQSATWGTDALAGVINIIRRKGVTGQYLAASAEYGSFDTLNVGLDGGWTGDRFEFSGGFAYFDTDGINFSREGDEKDGIENKTGNVALAINATDSLKLNFSGQWVDATTDYDDFDFFVTGLPTDADRVTQAQRTYLRGEAMLEPVDSPWSGSLSVNWMDSDNDNYADGAWDNSTAAQTLEWRLQGSVLMGETQNHQLTFALDREDVDFKQRGTASFFGDPNQNQSYDVSGYAAEYVGNPMDDLTWTLSGRLDDFSEFDNAFTWQVAASYRLNSRMKLRASAGTGSKAPTFTERFGFYPNSFIGNPDLKPESSSGWELGLDTSLQDGQFHLGLAYFWQELKDEIDGFVFDPESFLFTAMNKDGKSKRKGIEFVFDGTIVSTLTFSATYTYLDASEEDFSGNYVTEVRRPRHTGSLNLNFGFLEERGNLNLNLNYNGTQLDSYFPPPAFQQETVELDAFTVLDFTASWELGRDIEFIGRVTNLLDQDYEEVLGFRRPGRGIYAGLRGRFEM